MRKPTRWRQIFFCGCSNCNLEAWYDGGQALQVELLNTRMQSMGLEPVTGPQSLEIQDESNRQFLDDIRHAYTIAFWLLLGQFAI